MDLAVAAIVQLEIAVELVARGRELELHGGTGDPGEGKLGGAGHVGEAVEISVRPPGEHGHVGGKMPPGGFAEVPFDRNVELDAPGRRILMVVTGGEQGQAVARGTPGTQVHIRGHGGRKGRCGCGGGRRESLEKVAGSVVAQDGNPVAYAPGEGFFSRIGSPGIPSITSCLDGQDLDVRSGFRGHFFPDGAGNERHGGDGSPEQSSLHASLL